MYWEWFLLKICLHVCLDTRCLRRFYCFKIANLSYLAFLHENICKNYFITFNTFKRNCLPSRVLAILSTSSGRIMATSVLLRSTSPTEVTPNTVWLVSWLAFVPNPLTGGVLLFFFKVNISIAMLSAITRSSWLSSRLTLLEKCSIEWTVLFKKEMHYLLYFSIFWLKIYKFACWRVESVLSSTPIFKDERRKKAGCRSK